MHGMELYWHAYLRANDRAAVDKLVGRMQALVERPIEVQSAERYWKDGAIQDVRMRSSLGACDLDAAILETMPLLAPLGGWRLGAPQLEGDGTGRFEGMLSLNGGDRLVISGTELLMIETEGPIAVGGALERFRR